MKDQVNRHSRYTDYPDHGPAKSPLFPESGMPGGFLVNLPTIVTDKVTKRLLSVCLSLYTYYFAA